jgi:hypothetical protein
MKNYACIKWSDLKLPKYLVGGWMYKRLYRLPAAIKNVKADHFVA